MIPRAAFSLHGNIVRYRGEDVAHLLLPRTSITEGFLAALGCATDADTNTLLQDIVNLENEIDYLRIEATKALKFLDVEPARAKEILDRMLTDDPN